MADSSHGSNPPSPQFLMRKYLAEFIGTFALVAIGCGAIIVDGLYGGLIGHLGIAAAFGLTVAVMIYALGDLSGAHFNPAVSFGFCWVGLLPWKEYLPYAISQSLAAILAAALLQWLFPETTDLGTTLPSGGMAQAFVVEVLLTFLLMFVIISVAVERPSLQGIAGFAIGMTVFIGALFGGPISGASMNPARSLGPALLSGAFEAHWLYWLAPILGSSLAVLTWQYLRSDD